MSQQFAPKNEESVENFNPENFFDDAVVQTQKLASMYNINNRKRGEQNCTQNAFNHHLESQLQDAAAELDPKRPEKVIEKVLPVLFDRYYKLQQQQLADKVVTETQAVPGNYQADYLLLLKMLARVDEKELKKYANEKYLIKPHLKLPGLQDGIKLKLSNMEYLDQVINSPYGELKFESDGTRGIFQDLVTKEGVRVSINVRTGVVLEVKIPENYVLPTFDSDPKGVQAITAIQTEVKNMIP